MSDQLAPLKAVPQDLFLDCIHCGLCLDSCPTYVITGSEADSPRGRIYFMRSLAEGRAQPVPEVLEHLDRCLDCRACQTACPSGVQYGRMIEPAREVVKNLAPRGLLQRLLRNFLIPKVLSRPGLLRLSLIPARLAQALGLMPLLRLLPGLPGRLARLLPDGKRGSANSSSAAAGPGPEVRLLQGCAMEVLFPHVNRASLSVLNKLGFRASAPEGQGCCGALALHSGDPEGARACAKDNIAAFEKGGWPEAIVSNAAGCGLVMKEYEQLLAGEPEWADRAKEFSKRVKDLMQLAQSRWESAKAKPLNQTITLHEPCHLVHGQGLGAETKALLGSIPGLKVKELQDSTWCCGAAGTYNLTQPEFSDKILGWKVGRIKETGAGCVVAGNPPCMAQIGMGLREANVPTQVLHPAELLDQSL